MSRLRKCLVWDLDNTLWDGICLEGNVSVRSGAVNAILELDKRGILHSIASRGDEETAMKVLRENALDGFFLVPKINWLPKSQNITAIARELDIGMDAFAFIDDDEFEREQVAFMLPGILTLEAGRTRELPFLSDFIPAEITKEASVRRILYQTELERQRAEQSFASREDFLLSCRMKLKVRPAEEQDIPRLYELITRTHQLNTTGLIFSRDYITEILTQKTGSTKIMVAELEDKYGSYGIIGTAITEDIPPEWLLKYLALSCRVMGRGIERVFLCAMMMNAREAGLLRSIAEYRDTGKNRMMRALYQMTGFKLDDSRGDGEMLRFAKSLDSISELPGWVKLV